MTLPFLSTSLPVVQFWAMCPNPPQLKHLRSPSPCPLSTAIAPGSLSPPVNLGAAPLCCQPPLGTQPLLNVPLFQEGRCPPDCCAFPPLLPRIFSSALLCLMLRSSWTALSCHCVIVVGGVSALANLLLIVPFSPLLNSSTRALPSYPLPLAALLNSCTYSSTVLPPCSKTLNSSTFRLSSSNSPNSCLIFVNNSSTVCTADVPLVISSKMLSFQVRPLLPAHRTRPN